MRNLLTLAIALWAVSACGKSGGGGGGSTEPVREIAVGGDLAMNRAVQRVKPSQTNPALLYQKLKEYNNSINGACPNGGYYQTGGNINDNDYDGVFPGGYYLFSSCIFEVPNEYAIPVYVYVDGNFIGLDPNDNNPYVYKAVLQNLFFLIYVQDPYSGNAYFFADYYPHDTLYVSGNASGVSSDEDFGEDLGWGYDNGSPGGEITFCEYMGNQSDSLGASYQPDDGQFNPNADENANYYAGGYYLYSYENYQQNNTCNDSQPVDSIGAGIDINPSGSGGNALHDDVNCKYDPSNGGQSGTKEFNSGKARLKNRASGAINEISYGSDCKSSFSSGSLYGYVPNFGPNGGILGIEKMIEYKLKTEPAHKLFSNQRVNAEIVNKFQKIKEKVSIKHAQMKIKLEKLKAIY
ncbi:MAG: hypothetical protein RQ990_02835 [Candidatus Hydrothermia bacterium]|jgi:hypothetical protein|nr:hypothetical protein [Candidatus Hydrothermia bacterium]